MPHRAASRVTPGLGPPGEWFDRDPGSLHFWGPVSPMKASSSPSGVGCRRHESIRLPHVLGQPHGPPHRGTGLPEPDAIGKSLTDLVDS